MEGILEIYRLLTSAADIRRAASCLLLHVVACRVSLANCLKFHVQVRFGLMARITLTLRMTMLPGNTGKLVYCN